MVFTGRPATSEVDAGRGPEGVDLLEPRLHRAHAALEMPRFEQVETYSKLPVVAGVNLMSWT